MPIETSTSERPSPSTSTPGVRLQGWLDELGLRAARRPAGPAVLGMALALMAIVGGIGMFIVVWAVLVGVLH